MVDFQCEDLEFKHHYAYVTGSISQGVCLSSMKRDRLLGLARALATHTKSSEGSRILSKLSARVARVTRILRALARVPRAFSESCPMIPSVAFRENKDIFNGDC